MPTNAEKQAAATVLNHYGLPGDLAEPILIAAEKARDEDSSQVKDREGDNSERTSSRDSEL